jgi:cell division protein ZapB
MTQLQQLAERVERLLLRHEELQRTNALLLRQLESLGAERDSLKSRLSAARTRIDHLIDKLPQQAAQAAQTAQGAAQGDSSPSSDQRPGS